MSDYIQMVSRSRYQASSLGSWGSVLLGEAGGLCKTPVSELSHLTGEGLCYCLRAAPQESELPGTLGKADSSPKEIRVSGGEA